MKENIILIGILCITISSCKPGSGSNNKSHAKDVSIAIDLDREDKLSLYDLFSSIELIPLETKNESLLQFLMEEPDQVYKIDDLFYLLDRPQDAVFIFNQDGKFIRRVSKSGKGNGEYVSADAFAITDHHQIEILSSIGRSIYCYDSLGMNFLERRIFPSELPVIHHFFPLNEDEYILYASHPKENEGNMYIYSWKDKNYTKLGYKLPDWTPFGPKLSVPFYMLNDQLCFAQTYNGDVFTLSKDKKQLNLRYSWDFGDKTFSLSAIPENKELSYYIDMLKNISYDYAIQFLIYKENSSFYFTRFKYKNRYKHLIYDKATKSYRLFEHFTEGGQCVPQWIDEKAIYTFINPYFIHNVIDLSKLNNADKQRLPTFSNHDNPVVIKYNFK